MKIQHNKYDETGKVIGTFFVEYPENETANEIKITDEWVKTQGKRMKAQESFESVYTGYEKTVTYEGRKLNKMTGSGKAKEIVLEFADGKHKTFNF